MVIKRSPGGQACRWRAINFEIHLWSPGKNADCIFGDRSASSMSKWRPAWTLTPEKIHFRTKSVTLRMLIDLLIIVHVDRRRWRAHQLTYDLKRCLLFRKCLRFSESESSFGAYVCHRRPGGSMATSHLVGVCSGVCVSKWHPPLGQHHGDQKISWWTLQVAGSQLRNPPVKFRHERWLHLAIDRHPARPNRARRELWPRKWFLLGRNPWLGLLCGLRLKSICVQFTKKKKNHCKALVIS